MRIVLLHGRAAAVDIPGIMARDYVSALQFGLARITAPVDVAKLDVRVAFYGDLWRPDANQPLPRIEPTPEVVEAFPGLGEISLWVDEHLGIGEALLDSLLRDVDEYFSEPRLRSATNAPWGSETRIRSCVRITRVLATRVLGKWPPRFAEPLPRGRIREAPPSQGLPATSGAGEAVTSWSRTENPACPSQRNVCGPPRPPVFLGCRHGRARRCRAGVVLGVRRTPPLPAGGLHGPQATDL
jgi:hypothetical protein